ncbi:MAG: LPXTG cell wall anchor domain-containing protein, partial [Candidatus Kariarchaeaceae archaeon]
STVVDNLFAYHFVETLNMDSVNLVQHHIFHTVVETTTEVTTEVTTAAGEVVTTTSVSTSTESSWNALFGGLALVTTISVIFIRRKR